MADIPPHIQRRVAALRNGMNTVPHEEGSQSFDAVFEIFLELAPDRAFIDLGEVDDAKDVLPILDAICVALFGAQAGKVTLIGAFRIAELGMRHGPLLAGTQPGYFFLFDEDHRGMMGVHGANGLFRMTRFTLSPVGPGEKPAHLGSVVPGVH